MLQGAEQMSFVHDRVDASFGNNPRKCQGTLLPFKVTLIWTFPSSRIFAYSF